MDIKLIIAEIMELRETYRTELIKLITNFDPCRYRKGFLNKLTTTNLEALLPSE